MNPSKSSPKPFESKPQSVLDGPLGELEQILREMIAHHEKLADLSVVCHDAMRRADTEALGSCIQAENEVVQMIADTEKKRIRVVGVLASHLGSPARNQTKLSWIAERCPESARVRVEALSGRLVASIRALHERNAILQAAAETLSRHMNGIRKQLNATLNHAKTYGCKGAVDAGPSVISAIDLRS